MSLIKKHIYVAIDFETTGLDVLKDDAIQVWIVFFDQNLTYKSHFSSYIKPQKDIEKLRDCVSLITWLDLENVQNAPDSDFVFDQIYQKIKDNIESEDLVLHYENLVFLWHNISFDIKFLCKYIYLFKQNKSFGQIDTFWIAQSFLPYMTSYSLESIHWYLISNKDYLSIFEDLKKNIIWLSYHDALFDAMISACIFKFFKKKSDDLSQKRNLPSIDWFRFSKWEDFETFVWNITIPKLQKPILNKNIKIKFDEEISNIIEVFEKRWIIPKKNSNFEDDNICPSLSESLSNPVYLSNIKKNIQDFDKKTESFSIKNDNIKKINIMNIWIENFIKTLIQSGWKYILSVSNISKLDKIKNIFKNIWWTNFGFLNKDQNIEHDIFRQFWTNNNLNLSELFFLYKYFFHYEKWLSLIDTITDDEKKIIFLLQKNIENTDFDILITTHPWFYRNVENIKKNHSDYVLFFLDIDRRYNTYNFFSEQEFDFFTLIELFEKLEYFYQKISILDNKKINTYKFLEKIKNQITILSANFFSTVQKLSANKWSQDFFVQDIENHKWFEKFVLLSEKFFENVRCLIIDFELEKEHIDLITRNMIKYKNIIWQWFLIKDKIYNNSFVYHNICVDTKYTDFSEFLINFQDIKTVFVSIVWWEDLGLISNTNNQNDHISNQKSQYKNTNKQNDKLQKKINQNIQKINQVFDIINLIKKSNYKNILIISGKKEESNRLVSEIKKNNLDKKYQILAENITWWAKKHLSKIENNDPKILIWWYQMAMMTKTKNRNPDIIIAFCTFGSMQDLILADISWR